MGDVGGADAEVAAGEGFRCESTPEIQAWNDWFNNLSASSMILIPRRTTARQHNAR